LTALERLAAELEAEGGLVAGALTGEIPPDELEATDPEYGLLLEAIREGALLHYGRGRLLAPEDPDLALLAGDRLYAIGLDRLAALGDVTAVAELADIISLIAQAHAEEDPERAEAAWRARAGALARRPA
jgi:hypothetical protein